MSDRADISPEDRSFLYGDGLFETVAVRQGGAVRWLDYHIERFERSAKLLGFAREDVEAGRQALEALPRRQPGIWRVTISRSGDDAPFGGAGHVRCRRRPLYAPERPRLQIAAGWYQPGDRLAEHKTTSYLRSVEARRRAKRDGFDDVVMTSRSGLVGESSCANVVVVRKDGQALTPPIDGVLPGVTRRGLLELSERKGEPIEVGGVTVEMLRDATEVALLSAGVGVVAAASLEGRELGDTWSQRASDWLEEVS